MDGIGLIIHKVVRDTHTHRSGSSDDDDDDDDKLMQQTDNISAST